MGAPVFSQPVRIQTQNKRESSFLQSMESHPLWQKSRQHVQQVLRSHGVLSQPTGRQIAGPAMKSGGTGRGLQSRYLLPQKRSQNTGQHITAAAGCHSGIPCSVDISFLAIGNDRFMALSQNHTAG